MKWVKLERDKTDIEKGYNLCPICKAELEIQIDSEGLSHKERCSKGCYIYDFDKSKRIK